MYYIKIMNGDDETRVEITDENVFTDCPVCGDAKQIDLAEVFRDDGCLYSVKIYCQECAKRVQNG